MTFGKLAKDFQSLLRSIQSFTDQQAHVTDWDCDKLTWVKVQVRPKDGPYSGGSFDFMVELPKRYPREPPNVTCMTSLYHPNIDPEGDEYNVCLSLFDEWQETYGLQDTVQGLLFLMKNPNLEDPLSPYFDPGMDEEEFIANVKLSMKGEEVEDVSMRFDCVLCVEDSEEKVTHDSDLDSGLGGDGSVPETQEDSEQAEVTLCVTEMVDCVTYEAECVFELKGLFEWDTPQTVCEESKEKDKTKEFCLLQPFVLDDKDDSIENVRGVETVNSEDTTVTEQVTAESVPTIDLGEFGWEQVIILDDEDEESTENLRNCEAHTEDNATPSKPFILPASYYEAKRVEMLKHVDEVIEGLTDKDFECDDEEEDDEYDEEVNDDESIQEEEGELDCDNDQRELVERENANNGLLRQVSKLDRTDLIEDEYKVYSERGFGANKLLSVRNCMFMDPQLDGPLTYIVSLALAYFRNRLL